MNSTRWLTLLITAFLFVGCGGKSEKSDPTVPDRTASDVDPIDLDAVDAQTLESSPCGNPDWSTLPPQSTAQPR